MLYFDHNEQIGTRARANLRLLCNRVFVPGIRKRENLLSASITPATRLETEQLFLSYRANKVPFHQELEEQPWEAMTFIVEDPDDNLLLFAGSTSPKSRY